MKPSRNLEALKNSDAALSRTQHHSKTPEARRRSIIRMTFQVRAQLENRKAVKWTATELIERIQNTQPNGCAAAKAARTGNFFCD